MAGCKGRSRRLSRGPMEGAFRGIPGVREAVRARVRKEVKPAVKNRSYRQCFRKVAGLIISDGREDPPFR